jgi:MFS family permease
VAGSLAGGRLADWLVTRGVSPIGSRKWPMAAALLLTAVCTVGVALVASNAVAVGLLSVSLFLIYVSTATAWAMAPVAAPASLTASIGAVQNFGGYVGGALAPTVTGLIVQGTGSFVPALIVGAGMCVFAAVSYFVILRRPITPGDLQGT